MDWIKKIVPTLGLLIGIIFVAIGGVMTLGSTLKYFFIEPDLSYVDDGCMYKFDSTLGKDVQLDENLKQDCIEKRTLQETTNQKNNFKRNLIDGLSFLVTGLTFWIIWNRKKHT